MSAATLCQVFVCVFNTHVLVTINCLPAVPDVLRVCQATLVIWGGLHVKFGSRTRGKQRMPYTVAPPFSL